MEICTSHYNEDLEWLHESEFPVTVVGHEGEAPHTFKNSHVIPNLGYELSSYLYFILTRWDTLPEFTVFLHGHENAWHQKGQESLLERIRRANTEKYKYIPLNNMYVSKFFIGQCEFGQKIMEIYVKMYGLNIPRHIFVPMSNQCIVHKSLIQKYPIQMYEKLYNFIMSMNQSDSHTCADTGDILFTLLYSDLKCSAYDLIFYPREDFFDPPLDKPFILYDVV